MDDYNAKEKGNFQARNKTRRKFVIMEILAREYVKQIYSEPENQGYKSMLLFTLLPKRMRLILFNNEEL